MASAKAEVYDLLILVDATYSMFNYLEALQTSLPKIIQLSQLTDCFERVGLLAYRDYSEHQREVDGLLKWSGWMHTDAMNQDAGISSKTLMGVARQLEPIGGGDFPEATKTGLAKAHQLARADATTIVLLYTDATPHIAVDGSGKDRKSNQSLEKDNLTGAKPSQLYNVHHPEFADWVSAANVLRNGNKKFHVFSFLDESLASWKCLGGYYSYLSAMTRGACFHLTQSDPTSIASITVDVLLCWMGAEKTGSESVKLPANLVRYMSGQSIRQLKHESDLAGNDYFWATGSKNDAEKRTEKNMTQTRATSDILKSHIPKKRPAVQNFAERYKQDESYKGVVREQIASLIETDITAFSLNPVFGSLWRAVCNDRKYEQRDTLLNAFSVAVDRIQDTDEKTRMKAWLEESYDYVGEITDMVESIPTDGRFPCLFLDPTLRHSSGDEEDRDVADFRRDELLEIGRSCDYRILRRLGKVLTQLTYVENVEELPKHIKDANVPCVPLKLGNKEHTYQLFRILLHVVVPGTMLGPRASAVLAALAIKMGIKPLHEAATNLMVKWKANWNNLDNPETWNANCLSLLLDADRLSRQNQKVELLEDADRRLFDKLVAYKLAEANLLTTLTTKVGWTPDKSSMALGPMVVCRSCEYPRSVTVMADRSSGICGLCAAQDYDSVKQKEAWTHRHVSKDDSEETSATWVECSARDCRAQYVVYNTAQLRVRPKCHYCREKREAPVVECTKCLNRILWPKEYRTQAMRDNAYAFKCVSCSNGRQSIVDVETSAQALIKENGDAWLLENQGGVLQEPFSKRSLFHVASTVTPGVFLENVNILPKSRQDQQLVIKGKLVRNGTEIRDQLRSWIDKRRAEKVPCSLCFSDFHRSNLRAACGRHGCDQAICEACLKSWYGANSPGHIINPATLTCPFCRRAPAAKTLASYGMGIHAVGNLAKAFDERGTWIYAWCLSCSNAQQHLERSCARGAPPEIDDFVCESCVDAELERARLLEETARLDLAEARRMNWEMAQGLEAQLREAARKRVALTRSAKKCPKCNVPTEKTSGCDHLTCYCGAHWCWTCGKEFDVRVIYEHMNREHGGFYGDGEDEEDDYVDYL